MVLPSPGMADHPALAGDGRLRGVVHEADVVVVERAEVDVLAGIERLHRRDEAQVQRIRIGELLLERALPPLERLAGHRPGTELGSELLVEDGAAPVVGHAEPGRGKLLESRPGHPQDGVLGHAVALGLLRLLDQLRIARKRLALEAGLGEELVIVDERPHRGEIGQSPGLAVALGDGARERREVLDVLLHAGEAVDGRGDPLVDVAREILDGRLRDVHRIPRRVHGGELRDLRLDVRLDDLVELDAPVLLELLADLLVDLPVLPDHEGERRRVAGGTSRPWSRGLSGDGARQHAESGGGDRPLHEAPPADGS